MTWDSFRALDKHIFAPQGRNIDWVFLEVHAEGELICHCVNHVICVTVHWVFLEVHAEGESDLRFL